MVVPRLRPQASPDLNRSCFYSLCMRACKCLCVISQTSVANCDDSFLSNSTVTFVGCIHMYLVSM